MVLLTAMEQAVALRWTRLTLQRPVMKSRIGIPKRFLSNVVEASKQEAVPKWYKQYKLKLQERYEEEPVRQSHGNTTTLEKLDEIIPVEKKKAPGTSTKSENSSQRNIRSTTKLEKPEENIPVEKKKAPRILKSGNSSTPETRPTTTTVPRKSVKETRPTPEFHPFAGSAFGSLNLSSALVKRLQKEGYKTPTGIQASAIPLLLEGHDAALQSYTGSGKTLAYLLPVLSKVGPLRDDPASDENKKGWVDAVIVTPSRELGMQIVREAEKILGHENRRMVQQLIGGANIMRQEEALKKNKPFLIVGTPGRISELSRTGKLHTHSCRFLVLDESDQLLSMKYRNDMKRILEHVGLRRASPGEAQKGDGTQIERQTILVSATMPPAVLKAAQEWGRKPLLIKPTSNEQVGVEEKAGKKSDEGAEDKVDARGAMESLPPNLAHYYVVAQARHRVDTVRRCINALDAQTVLVFMNFTHRLKDTVFKLEAKGMVAGCLHGEQGKMERANVLSAFKNKKLRVLVVSEVGARGLDVPECDLVVNLELPTDATHYAHRGGRAGRLGREGSVVSICEQPEAFVLKKFEKQLGISIVQCEVSHGILSLFDNTAKESSSPV